MLPEIDLDMTALQNERIVTAEKSDMAHVAFDVLRTRLLKTMRDNGWFRIGITSGTKGCGKTVCSANLAFSFARNPDTRVVLIDMDLKAPRLAKCLAVNDRRAISWYLNGSTTSENFFLRYGPNLALGLNTERVTDSAELIEGKSTSAALESIAKDYAPDVMLFDLSPMLVTDDPMVCLRHLDGVLLIASVGETTADEIEECEALLAENTNFLGVILNKAERGDSASYGYSYGYGGGYGYGYGYGYSEGGGSSYKR